MKRECSIPGCGEKHYALGWCQRHYQSNRRYGDPLAAPQRVAGPWRHGTENGYQNHRCRCVECTDAHRVYYREKVAGVCGGCGGRVSNRYAAVLCDGCNRRRRGAHVVHGTAGMYRRGCRCELCRAASAAERKQRRRRAKQRLEANDG